MNNYDFIKDQIITELKPYFSQLILDQNANHVIQKLLETKSKEKIEILVDHIIEDVIIY